MVVGGRTLMFLLGKERKIQLFTTICAVFSFWREKGKSAVWKRTSSKKKAEELQEEEEEQLQ